MKFFRPLLTFLFHLGYFGPLLMGVMDSSFLFLPFGNDLLIVGLIAQRRPHPWIYVLTAALGSTLGALLLALVARKFGEAGMRKLAGEKRFNRLCGWISKRGALAIAGGAIAPPPFPYTLVIAAAGALDYSIPRLLTINFFARAVRFTILALLAARFGPEVLRIAQSPAFKWTMAGFVILCIVVSAFSIYKWFHVSRSR